MNLKPIRFFDTSIPSSYIPQFKTYLSVSVVDPSSQSLS